MGKVSPTQRTLAHLRKTYPLVQVVEHWNSFAGIRQDLFGIIDVLAVGEDIAMVQTTTKSNMRARIEKILASPALPHLLAARIKVIVHGWWKQANGRWALAEHQFAL